MLGRRGKSSKKVAKNPRDPAAIKIQCMIRIFRAKVRMRQQAQTVWQRVYDPTYKRYFFFNTLSGSSQWTKPAFVTLFNENDHEAATTIQRMARGFVGRHRARKTANQKYTRFYDSNLNKFYWLDKTTNQTTWVVTNWLRRMDIDMPPEDQMLYDSQQKIRDLEEQLKMKDLEIKEVRKKRFEELEPEVIKDRVENAKALKRSKDMDEWKTDELAAWFIELKMEEYIPALFANRVDGLLFINLTDDEWVDLGITNRIHIRKLQLILKAYRVRYQRKKDRVEVDEDDDLLSEVSPSELSALLEAEDAEHDEFSSEGSSDDSYDSDEELQQQMTDEQRLQKQLDAHNIKIDLMVPGDSINYPMIGDIVRVKYVATLTDSGKVVMSTKNVLHRAWVEFVLGIDQVLKGFDRALPQMSVGERSKLTFTPEYAYGKSGLPPHIPPDSTLTFDLTLLGFRARTVWIKPLIQDTNTNEKPYHDDLKIAIELARTGQSGVSSRETVEQLLSLGRGGPGGGGSGILQAGGENYSIVARSITGGGGGQSPLMKRDDNGSIGERMSMRSSINRSSI